MSDDRGVATVWAAGAIAVLVSMAVFGLHLGEAMVVRHQVESAADLAALAGAATVVAGEHYACSQARRVTDRMRVRLEACRTQGWNVLVEVTARPAGWLATLGTATARARAGPAAVASRHELDSTDVLLDEKVRAAEFMTRGGVQ
jgi:secretion/DNA translocation related TadE-like protein